MRRIALLGIVAFILGYFVLSSGMLPPAVQVYVNRGVAVVRIWAQDLGWMLGNNRDCSNPEEMQKDYCSGKK